ncbi:MAG: adenosine deaminase [Armatimonadetes bacterium]|nr:adenosine deaminase [Armatimonadota bacterium]MBX3108099.1 adenosine deaminase [Fimbriimonadaceae bacterium]
MVSIEQCRAMPKVELHVHLEGSIRPQTLIRLAEKNKVALPADTVEGLAEWYRFRDFPHFVEIYTAVSSCIRTPEDIEFVATEFLQGQAEQNILWSEATYTAGTIAKESGIPWDEQLGALGEAMVYGHEQLGIHMGLIIDIVRGWPVDYAMEVADWAIRSMGRGVVALGLSGIEGVGQTAPYAEVFALAERAELPIVPHAGETQGAYSIWDALEYTGCQRIGHGIRCLEDKELVRELRRRGTVLEVCPTSNICLTPIPDLGHHPIAEMHDLGLAVTINSDDPPMFGTTLSDEFARCSAAFGWDGQTLSGLIRTAAESSLCPERDTLTARVSQ